MYVCFFREVSVVFNKDKLPLTKTKKFRSLKLAQISLSEGRRIRRVVSENFFQSFSHYNQDPTRF